MRHHTISLALLSLVIFSHASWGQTDTSDTPPVHTYVPEAEYIAEDHVWRIETPRGVMVYLADLSNEASIRRANDLNRQAARDALTLPQFKHYCDYNEEWMESFEHDPLHHAEMQGRNNHANCLVDERIDAAQAHPLGSFENPIRGNRGSANYYFMRLQCEDGNAPSFHRIGNVGPGPYESIVDLYEVDCPDSAPKKQQLHYDMYHGIYIEVDAPEGYSIRLPE